MALISCKECNNQISSNAKKCPHCGVKVAQSGCLPALIVGGMVLGAIMSLSESPSDTKPSQYVTTTSKTTSQESKTFQTEPKIESTINIWQYHTPLDEVSGKFAKTAKLQSNNIVHLDFPYNGGTFATLVVRKHPRDGKNVFVVINKGQLNCQYNNCYISLRFDDGPVLKNFVTEPTDNSNLAFFLSKPNTIIKNIKNSKKMYIELTFFSQGIHTFEFNTESFDEQLVS